MATFYVKYRKKGPTGVYSVVASTLESAISAVRMSAAAGEEYDISAASTNVFDVSAVTGPTGP